MRDYLYRVVTGHEKGLGATVVKVFLTICSFFYVGIVIVRNLLYDQNLLRKVSLGKPAISVGNLTWGGVGKTPMVILLAQYIRAKGFTPAILTRGYMAQSAKSDEVELFKKEIPGVIVGVGADRIKAAKNILTEGHVDIFILDDGFQRRQVQRDLDIVLLDCTDKKGGAALIPAGIAREPFDALKRSHFVVLTKTDLASQSAKDWQEKIKALKPSLAIAWAKHQPQNFTGLFGNEEKLLTELSNHEVIIFSSIGDPVSFEEMLKKLGIRIANRFVFSDHHAYSQMDAQMLAAEAKRRGLPLITTAKDAVKLQSLQSTFDGVACWILNIKFEIQTEKEELFGRVDHLLGR